MIKINYVHPIPRNLDSSTIEYKRILVKNIQIYRRRLPNENLEFDFIGYNNQSNKKLIRDLTKGRCAYCGVRVTVSSQLEIEHYRPKKRLDIRGCEFILNKKSNYKFSNNIVGVVDCGYFYHGNDYKNLLPSCSVCNKGISGAVVVVDNKLVYGMPFGKKNFFPIRYKRKNGKCTDYRVGKGAVIRIKDEIPLLYNPYLDDPMELFSYKKRINVEGAFYIKVSVSKNLSRHKKLLANVSINILGLNRIELCKKRFDIWDDLIRLKENVSADVKSNNMSITTWARHAIQCSNYFDVQSGELIGFARAIGGGMPGTLRKLLASLFSVESLGVLTESESFEMIIQELKTFGNNNYNDDDFNSVEVVLGGFDSDL